MNRLFIAICTIAIFLAGQTNALLDGPLSPEHVSLSLLDVDGGLLNLRRSLPVVGGMTDSLPLVGGDGGLLNLRRSLPVVGGMTDSLPLVGGNGGLLNLRRGMPGLDTLGSLPGMDALTGAIPKGFMKVRRSKAVVDSSRLEARAPELLADLLGKAAPTAAGLTDTLDKVGV